VRIILEERSPELSSKALKKLLFLFSGSSGATSKPRKDI
jgi:hypothetical protein